MDMISGYSAVDADDDLHNDDCLQKDFFYTNKNYKIQKNSIIVVIIEALAIYLGFVFCVLFFHSTLWKGDLHYSLP